VGAFFHKFSISHFYSGKTTDRIKKVRGCKNGADILYHLVNVGIVGRAPAVNDKVLCFLSVCTKKYHFANYGVVSPHFKDTAVKWRENADLRAPRSPRQILYKKIA